MAGVAAPYSGPGGAILSNMAGVEGRASTLTQRQYDFNNRVSNILDFDPTLGSGKAADTALTAAVAATPSGGIIRFPAGTYTLTNFILSKSLTIQGDGDGTVIQVGANNSFILEVAAPNVTVKRIKWLGDMTGVSSITGIAILLAGARFTSRDCLYTNFWFGAISGIANTAMLGPRLYNNRFTDNGGVTNTSDVYMGGAWQRSIYQNNDFLVTTALCGTAIFHYELSSAVWYDVQIRGGSIEGYQKWGIVCTDETWDGSDRVYDFLVDGVSLKNVQFQGIKCKVSRGIRITNCFLDNCSQQAENQGAGLYGSIFCNSLDRVLISGNQVRNSGTDGIRVNCGFQYPNWNPGGQACTQFTVANNQVFGAGKTIPAVGNGISMINPIKQGLIIGNNIRDISVIGIYVLSTATLPIWDVGIFNNSVTDCQATCSNAYMVQFARTLRMDGNIGQNAGVNVAFLSDIDTVLIGGSDMMVDPRTGPGARGYQFVNTNDVTFNGKAGNSVYSAWAATTAYTMGQLIHNGSSVYQCVVAGTSAGSGGPVGTGAQVDGTVTWYFIGFYQGMTNALVFTGTMGTVTIGAQASFKNLLGAAVNGAPAAYRRANIATGTATFPTATTVAVTLPATESDALYRVALCPQANQAMWVTGKTTGGFTINTATAGSTALVDWAVQR